MTIKVHETVGRYCITADGGQKLYDLIYPQLRADNPVELDFTGVDVFASPFFNFAIGQLLRDFPPDRLNHLVRFSALKPNGRKVLERVIDNAKHYYSDEKFHQALDAVIAEKAREAVAC